MGETKKETYISNEITEKRLSLSHLKQ